MWIRSAFFEGPRGQKNEGMFRITIEEKIAPAIAKLDGVRAVEMLWSRTIEDRPADILGQMLVHFDDEEGIARMIASDGRASVRALVAELLELVDVKISHINYEVA
ncbi:hypothetical protein [Rhizorhabdus wittichii]